MKKKVFPSQIKYRQNNPAISFRLKAVDKEKLDGIIKASGKPLSQWMTDFIHEKLDPNGATSELVERIDALECVIEELKDIKKFTVPCSVCGKPMYFNSNNSNWSSKIYPKLREAFKGYHPECKPG